MLIRMPMLSSCRNARQRRNPGIVRGRAPQPAVEILVTSPGCRGFAPMGGNPAKRDATRYRELTGRIAQTCLHRTRPASRTYNDFRSLYSIARHTCGRIIVPKQGADRSFKALERDRPITCAENLAGAELLLQLFDRRLPVHIDEHAAVPVGGIGIGIGAGFPVAVEQRHLLGVQFGLGSLIPC